jgi:2-keto-4-pentenoate hydratase/2-oxohepta-3-ene-1,7-dioic acid hydratase in catechol pathway
MKYAIEMGPLPALPVVGSSEQFPVGRIYCVGRNYADHAREMGHDPDREPPFFFMKPANAIVPNNSTIPFPQATKDLHHEIELVVALSKGGAEIPVEKALDHVWGYGVGLAELIWNIPETISYLSGLITLQPGDLIYSGTPAGVGPVKPGDQLEGHVDGFADLTITYAR